MERKTVIVDEDTALDQVKNGMTIALGGFITANHPMALIRGLIRRGIKDLLVIGSVSSTLDVDLLVAGGCVRRLVTAYVGAEVSAPVGPFYKRAAELGQIEVWECDEIIVMALLQASAQGLPFYPVRGGVGTDLPKLNPDLVEFRDPVRGEHLLAVPSMHIDVAFTHASQADQYGNVQYVGNCFADDLIQRAADLTVTSVEKIIPNEDVRAAPLRTAYRADLVVRAPYGAHPYSSHGFYLEDEEHLREYITAGFMEAKGDSSAWSEYRRVYLEEPQDHLGYLERIGLRRLLSLQEF